MSNKTKKHYSHRSQGISESTSRITEYAKGGGRIDTKKREREYDFVDDELDRPKRKRCSPIRLENEYVVTPNTTTESAPSGEPLNGDGMWTKQTIIEALSKLEGTCLTKQFIVNMLQIGKTPCSSDSGVYKMYNKWKASGSAPKDNGRPSALELHALDNKFMRKLIANLMIEDERSFNECCMNVSKAKHVVPQS